MKKKINFEWTKNKLNVKIWYGVKGLATKKLEFGY